MNCTHCGDEILEGTYFCPSCGEPVENSPPAPRANRRETVSRTTDSEAEDEAPQTSRFSRRETVSDEAPTTSRFGGEQRRQRMPPPPPPPEPSRSFNPLYVILPVVAVLVLVLALVGGWFFLNQNAIKHVQSSNYGEFPLFTIEELYTHCSVGEWSRSKDEGTWRVMYEGTFLGTNEPITVIYDEDSGKPVTMTLGTTVLQQEAATKLALVLASHVNEEKYNGVTVGTRFSAAELISTYVTETQVEPELVATYGDVLSYYFQSSTWEIVGPSTSGNCLLRWSGVSLDGEGTILNFDVNLSSELFIPEGGTANGQSFTDQELVILAYSVNEALRNHITKEAFQTEIKLAADADKIMGVYAKEIERYQEGERLEWTMEEYDKAGMAPLAPYYGFYNLYLAFYDLSENGIPEMIVAGDNDWILAVYTVVPQGDEYALKLLIASNDYSRLEIGNNGYIRENFVTAFDSSTTVYQLEESTLVKADTSKMWDWYTDEFAYDSMNAFLREQESSSSSSSGSTANNTQTSAPSNTETSTQTTPQTGGIASNESTYLTTLLDIAGAMWDGLGFSELRALGLSELYGYYNVSNAGYAFADINNDGVSELLVGELYDYTGSLIAMYTVKNGEIVCLLNAGERERYTLCSDGLIAYIGSSSASNTEDLTFELTPYGLVVVSDHRQKDAFNITDPYVPMYTSFSPFVIG